MKFNSLPERRRNWAISGGVVFQMYAGEVSYLKSIDDAREFLFVVQKDVESYTVQGDYGISGNGRDLHINAFRRKRKSKLFSDRFNNYIDRYRRETVEMFDSTLGQVAARRQQKEQLLAAKKKAKREARAVAAAAERAADRPRRRIRVRHLLLGHSACVSDPRPSPEGAIKHPKARALVGALVRGELLTQGEIFQDERLSMDEEAAQEASEHGHPGVLAGVGKSNDCRLDGVFAGYGCTRLWRRGASR